jgi:hypothetical protein
MDVLLQTAVNEANRQQVSFYSVDPTGLVTPLPDAAVAGPTTKTSHLRYGVHAPQEFLRELSSQTGGEWFLSPEDFQKGLRRAYRDSEEYYLIGYLPRRDTDSAHRSIEVKVARMDVSVRSRQGNFNGQIASTAEWTLINAFKFPELYDEDFPVHLTLGEGAEGRLEVRIQIPVSAVSFKPEGGESLCEIEVLASLGNELGYPQGGYLIDRKHRGRFKATQLQEWLAGSQSPRRVITVSSSTTRALAPGDYEMVVVVRQPLADKTVAHRLNFTIQAKREEGS